jgi:hypothetical protein
MVLCQVAANAVQNAAHFAVLPEVVKNLKSLNNSIKNTRG